MRILFDAAFILTIIILIVTNLRTMLLPNRITIPGFIGSVVIHSLLVRTEASVLAFFQPFISSPVIASLIDSLLGAAVAGIVLLLLNSIWGKVRGTEMIGSGDIKMMLMIGAYLGIPNIIGVLIISVALIIAFSILVSLWARRNLIFPSGAFWGIPAMFFTFVSANQLSQFLKAAWM
jgi:prepilin signal peptidase PulO-like enzyme (type II secretory pathway)